MDRDQGADRRPHAGGALSFLVMLPEYAPNAAIRAAFLVYQLERSVNCSREKMGFVWPTVICARNIA
jgi:hypothetical protein